MNFFFILCCNSITGHGEISASAKEKNTYCIALEKSNGTNIKFNSFLGSFLCTNRSCTEWTM